MESRVIKVPEWIPNTVLYSVIVILIIMLFTMFLTHESIPTFFNNFSTRITILSVILLVYGVYTSNIGMTNSQVSIEQGYLASQLGTTLSTISGFKTGLLTNITNLSPTCPYFIGTFGFYWQHFNINPPVKIISPNNVNIDADGDEVRTVNSITFNIMQAVEDYITSQPFTVTYDSEWLGFFSRFVVSDKFMMYVNSNYSNFDINTTALIYYIRSVVETHYLIPMGLLNPNNRQCKSDSCNFFTSTNADYNISTWKWIPHDTPQGFRTCNIDGYGNYVYSVNWRCEQDVYTFFDNITDDKESVYGKIMGFSNINLTSQRSQRFNMMRNRPMSNQRNLNAVKHL